VPPVEGAHPTTIIETMTINRGHSFLTIRSIHLPSFRR
jgi:hypothetical protein